MQLPFSEDVKNFTFPMLSDRYTKSGARVLKHAFLPTEELEASMDKFVDALDLNILAEEVDG